MLDFVTIRTRKLKKGITEIYPEFVVDRSNDLMIRGKAFYAVWDDELGLWSRDEYQVRKMVDKMVYKFADDYETDDVKVLKLMKDYSSNVMNQWQKYCKVLPDNYVELDEKVVFQNDTIKKTDYISRVLPYPLDREGTCDAYNEIMEILYDPKERKKLEWAIGAIISGDSKHIQKFIVLYGAPGSGKSTVLNIIQDLFPGCFSVFDSKSLASSSNAFALEAFRNNPLLSIQHDGDLSKIEDNTKLNSIVSHEYLTINEKFKATYEARFNSFLFLGTNKPVKITDSKSGILRRLIDVSPSGNKMPYAKYIELTEQAKFELGAIAWHCLQVYNKMGEDYYNTYVPALMLSTTNDFYNFVEDNYEFFMENRDGVKLSVCWLRYKEYCEEANVLYPYSKRLFKDELKNYFEDFKDRRGANDKNVYIGFRTDKVLYSNGSEDEQYSSMVEKSGGDDSDSGVGIGSDSWLKFDCRESLLDSEYADCPAQYATEGGTPERAWDDVTTVMRDINSTSQHYIRIPENLIVIDFDLKDPNTGEKSFDRNLAAASKWPKTYAELSKSGSGIHLHYIYDGDVNALSRIYDEDIEVKVYTGKSALRRMLTYCNDIPIATLRSGLPLKGVKKTVVEDYKIKSEADLVKRIKRNLRKEIHSSTRCSMDFIYKLLDEAYENGIEYDVRSMRPDIQQFALNSTHQADYCLKLINKMKFCSEHFDDSTSYRMADPSSPPNKEWDDDTPIIFFDVEVFPNLFLVNWKHQGPQNKVVRMINPSPSEIEELVKFRLVGFNNRKYDNHMLYARMMGYTEAQIYDLSQRIITQQDRSAFFGNAYNLSYTDVYDYMSAGNKMSLKKWEIKLHLKHKELDLPWDLPVPEELWETVAEYCDNDVIATEAVWNETQADFMARKILALMSGLTANDTTNSHTTKIIVGNDKRPQDEFVYTDLSTIFPGYRFDKYGINKDDYIPGTKIVQGKSIYMGEDPGEGGYAWAQPGMYVNVALLDIASMHPHSGITLNIFGDRYTKRFQNIVEARVEIKHEHYDEAKKMINEILDTLEKQKVLEEYLSDESKAKQLADALKTAINSVYGLTSATFENKLRDPRNEDNIIAKYGALFMINLKHKVQEMGYTVVHIKTDSIKIANADDKIISFVMDYGKEYGYTFEHEATYSKMCIVNDAVYIARYNEPKIDKKTGNEIWWTATGTQFQVPYVFKTLFSHEKLEFWDLCETKSVSTAMYLDMNENMGNDEHDYRFVGKVGLFCPVEPGCGGGILLRKKDDVSYSAVNGTKKPYKASAGEESVWRWMESDMVRDLGLEDRIDMSYYRHLADDAIEAISKYGDFEWFASDDTSLDMSWMKVEEGGPDEVPFEDVAQELKAA